MAGINKEIRIRIIEEEVSGWPEHMQADYRAMVDAGQSPVFAHMAVTRKPSGGETDKTFMARSVGIADQPLDDYTREHIASRSRRHGYKPRATDTYEPLAAAYPGDPAAFTNHGEGREKIKRARRRFDAPTEGDPHERVYDLHPDIVERNRAKLLQDDPGLAEKDQREVSEMIVDKHALKTK